MTHRTRSRVCVPTYMRNTYPGVGSVLRAIIACRPEDSLRPVLSYPSSSLANAPRQTHDYNPSFPFRSPDSFSRSSSRSPVFIVFLSKRGIYLSDSFLFRLFFLRSSETLAFLRGNVTVLFTYQILREYKRFFLRLTRFSYRLLHIF